MFYQRKDNHDERHQCHQQSYKGDETQRSYRERSDAIDTETQHLGKRIFTLACLTRLAVVINKTLLETELANNGTQEKIALRILHQRLQRAIRHHTEVGMIINHLLIHTLHQFIKGLSCETLKESIRLTLLAYSVDNILPFLYLFHHIDDYILIILQIRIDAHHRITMVDGSLHTCPECILVSTVMRKFDSSHVRMFFSPFPDELPGSIATAVIHQ